MLLAFVGNPQTPLASDGTVRVDVPAGGGVVTFDANGNPMVTPIGAATGGNIVSTSLPTGTQGTAVGQLWIQSTTNFVWWWSGTTWISLIGA